MLMAVIGLGPIVDVGKATLTEERRAKLSRLQERINKAARDFLTGGAWEKPRSPGAIEWKPWVSLMTMPENERRLRVLEVSKDLLDPEDAAAYAGQAMKSWNYLAAQFPRTMKRTLMGAVAEPPPEVYLYRFRRSYFVLDDPMGLLDQLLCGFINTDEQAAMAANLPFLYAESQKAFVQEAVAHKAKHPKWELPRKRWEPLRTFLGIARKPGYVAQLQARFAMPEAQETRTPGTLPRDPGEASQSQSQRAELR